MANHKYEFDLTEEDISVLDISRTRKGDSCIIHRRGQRSEFFNSLIVSKNTRNVSKVEISFFPQKSSGKYIPRFVFKKDKINGEAVEVKTGVPLRIDFGKHETPVLFWNLIAFFYRFKELVDMGEFEGNYSVIRRDFILSEFNQESQEEKQDILSALVADANLSDDRLSQVLFSNRSAALRKFLIKLRIAASIPLSPPTERPWREQEWQEFFESNHWIFGLGASLKFYGSFISKPQVGQPNSTKAGSPEADLLLIAKYFSLVELKLPSTPLFKEQKSIARAKTWDFSNELIEGMSQCLAQKGELEKNWNSKEFVKGEQSIDKRLYRLADPQTILLIGNAQTEFRPLDRQDNQTKSDCFERFRRNNRNLEIITYDELFERAYFLILDNAPPENWLNDPDFYI